MNAFVERWQVYNPADLDKDYFYLTGVDFVNPYGPECAIRFCLDGIVYCSVEDPDDGYRSAMDYISATKFSESGMTNTFPPVLVYASWDGETFSLKREDNSHLILQTGTDYSDDYYPTFVSWFAPEELGTINADTI